MGAKHVDAVLPVGTRPDAARDHRRIDQVGKAMDKPVLVTSEDVPDDDAEEN